jgi:benzoyl-CoA-dihydrodiol lyase
MFCTTAEGVRGQRALDWRLVDAIAKPAQFAAAIRGRAETLAQSSDRPAGAKAVTLPRIEREESGDTIRYGHIEVAIDRARRAATFTVRAPSSATVADPDALDATWWPFAMARQLDDAILTMRTNELDIGTWILKTQGDAASVLAFDDELARLASHGFVREVTGFLRRTLARLDVSSRTLYALIEPGSCFAGTLAELALAADRTYMLAMDGASAPRLTLSPMNFGAYPMVNSQTRIGRRFYDEKPATDAARAAIGRRLDAREALALGLVTATPDDIDWADEIRIALEERAAMSPDALTGMEANLRFAGRESMETRIFGRLTAWQNWIFQRPNAVGDKGALKVYGKGEKAAFDWKRV